MLRYRQTIRSLIYQRFCFFSRYIPEGLGCSCGPDWYTHNEEYNCSSYTIFLMITCFSAPISIIILCYAQLLSALRAVSPNPVYGWRLCFEFKGFIVVFRWQPSRQRVSTQKAEKEVSRMIVVMVGAFITCYGLYALAALYFAYSSDENKDYRLVTIPAFFSKSSCVYNPLIYAFMNKQVSESILTWAGD